VVDPTLVLASLVVAIWSGIALGAHGVAACLAAALSYALYILIAEHAVATRDPISLWCYGFFFASLFWAAVQPWWSFPDGVVGHTTAFVAWLVVLGAIVPFAQSPGLFKLRGEGVVLGAIAPAQTSR
jgi:drug/metabolite transporter (DMT)-like permease